MSIAGKVSNVYSVATGACLAGDVEAGATSVPIDNPIPFVDSVSQVQIGSDPQIYTIGPVGPESTVLELSPALSVRSLEGESVYVYPFSEEKRAQVQLGEGEDVIIATVLHSLYDNLPIGIRDLESQESVSVEQVGQGWVIRDIIAEIPVMGVRVAAAEEAAANASVVSEEALQGLQEAQTELAAAETRLDTAESSISSNADELTLAKGRLDQAEQELENFDINNLAVVGTANLNIAVAQEIAAKTAAFQEADIGNLFVTETSVLNDVVAQTLAAEVGEFITVRANNLESVMAIVTQLTSGGTGRRWEADPDGIRVFEADGTILINFPTDPSTPASFYGDLVATSLTVTDQLAIRGLINEISKGSQVVIASGTTAPSGAPQVVVDWESKTASVDADGSSPYDPYRQGWTRYGSRYYSLAQVYGGGLQIQRYLVSTGAREFWSSGYLGSSMWTNHSMTMIGNVAYVLATDPSGADYRVQGWDVDTLMKVSEWVYPHVYGSSGSAHRKPVIGTDGTNIMVAYTRFDNNLVSWRYFNPSTGAQVGSTIVSNLTAVIELAAVGQTSADFGGARVYIAFAYANNNVYSLSTAGTNQANETFPTPTGAVLRGLSWDATDGIFVGLDAAAAKFYRFTSTRWTGESAQWWISNTWYDSNATGGTHETAQGPRRPFVMKKRARLQVTTGLLPLRPVPNTDDDAVATRIYIGRGATDPGRAYMERVATLPDGSIKATLTGVSLPTGVAASPPPAASDFPASSPGRVISADGSSTILNGDGTAVLGGTQGLATSPTGVTSTAMRTVENRNSSILTLASAGAQQWASGPGVAFVAPASGQVEIYVDGMLKAAADGQSTSFSFEIKTGSTVRSGSLVLTGAASDGAINYNAQYLKSSGSRLVSGLVPGSAYNAYIIITSGSVGAAFSSCSVKVEPCF